MMDMVTIALVLAGIVLGVGMVLAWFSWAIWNDYAKRR